MLKLTRLKRHLVFPLWSLLWAGFALFTLLNASPASSHMEGQLLEGSKESSSPIARFKVALTFDDGPSPQTTVRLLNLLKALDVKATFFVVGSHAQQHLSLIKKIAQHGHEVGNHSYSHKQLTRLSPKSIKQELLQTKNIIFDATGNKPIWFRPPYGAYNQNIQKMASTLGMKTITWTIDPQDWRKLPPGELERRVVDKLQPNGVILLHEHHDTTLEALPRIIEKARQMGYEFVTLNELIA